MVIQTQCKKCGAINKYTNLHLNLLILYKEKIYCYNCGINLETLEPDIECDGYCSLSRKNNKKVDLPICCQIPFPNHQYLEKTKKPKFLLKDIQF